MDRSQQERRVVRMTATKTVKDVDAELQKETSEVNVNLLKAKLLRIEHLHDEVCRLDRIILDALLDNESTTDEEFNTETESNEEYLQKLTMTKLKIEEFLEKQESIHHKSVTPENSVYTSASGSAQSRKFKLPKTELKKFNGELKEWLGWWAQFQKIHEDQTLHATDKFQYLYQATVEGSRAREIVDAYPQSEENYPKVIEALTSRYGKKKLLKQMYVREMLKLINSPTRKVDGVSTLYYSLDSHTRALESLGVTSEVATEFLYPMVESALPEDLLVVWQRHPNYGRDGSKEDTQRSDLFYIMEFLKIKVENAEQRQLVKSEATSSQRKVANKPKQHDKSQEDVPTAYGLLEQKYKCLFCEKSNHSSQDCFRAVKMTLEEKRKKISEARGCFICFRKGHSAKFCKSSVRCTVCQKKHYDVMCPDRTNEKKTENKQKQLTTQGASEATASLSEIKCGGEVLLKTVFVRVFGRNGTSMVARLLFDEGSQSSYVTSHVTSGIQSQPIGEERVRNVMIDGTISNCDRFFKHKLIVRSLDGGRTKSLVLRERPRIGGVLPSANIGNWIGELRKQNITILDHSGSGMERHDIDLLVGSDYREQLMTGKRVDLSDGVFAVESVFGWMLCGPVKRAEVAASEMVIQSYLSGDVSQLWDLELLGVHDSAEKMTEAERQTQVKTEFQKKVKRDAEGRYVVNLPWVNEEVKSQLPTNLAVCEKRLNFATEKLKKNQKLDLYSEIFRGWEEEGFIRKTQLEKCSSHFLPHRPVFKMESTTTPVRPVFDASCRIGRFPSLNQCLEKGPNMLELIPSILLRFRVKKIGAISDIRKAFQMISVAEEDRSYQKFLWWDNEKEDSLQAFEHCRVVFGMTSSPFVLAAVLELHLKNVHEKFQDTATLLLRSLYVDNCVISFDTEEEHKKFKQEAIDILLEAKMDLRQWEKSTEFDFDKFVTNVLGLRWDKRQDLLFCEVPKEPDVKKVTKREVLSVASQVFDPIGFTAPALIQPKLMLQQAWASDLGWDVEWDEDQKEPFRNWCTEMEFLEKIKIPRHPFAGVNVKSVQLHVFTDASQAAYAGVVFVRVESDLEVSVQLLAAKSRVAPISRENKKKVTIPRLELMGCLIGARLFTSVKAAMTVNIDSVHFWTDSTTALSWIQRQENWGTFVGNRVKEIGKLTNVNSWKHVPGNVNPADLPSRGCSPRELLESKWWEGPEWLKDREENWPRVYADAEEQIVNSERRKTTLIAKETEVKEPRFGVYLQNVRVAAYVRRFVQNLRLKIENRVTSPHFSKQEMLKAEEDLIRQLQKERFGDKLQSADWKNLDVKRSDGLWKVTSRLLYKDDTENFRTPVLLPRGDPLVNQLINHVHRSMGHAGTQVVLGKLRERYWIQQGRKTVGKVIRLCVICRRHTSKKTNCESAPLPKDRVSTSFAFQTTGVDLAGPIILKGGTKAWIVLFTCAVYRGVHLDLVTSLSTEAFLESIERFINIIGRPNRIYSDNGTNFVGAKNLMKELDWKTLEEEFKVKEIIWTFNPPAAPWWGGFWERMVRSVKELFRRMMGNAKLTYEQSLTCIYSIAGTINDRPLTTLTEDDNDLTPLTPRMFMRDLPVGCFPEGDEIGADGYRKAYSKLQTMKTTLQARFRKEYLAMCSVFTLILVLVSLVLVKTMSQY